MLKNKHISGRTVSLQEFQP